MKSNDIEKLSSDWLELKEAERKATEQRREVEDKMLSLIGISETLDNTETVDNDMYLIKVVGRMNRKVDGELLQSLAAEHGLTAHLSSLFRWKPEINAAVWKASSESITKPLLGAIITTPGRPSFSIVAKT